ncbi:hypothetical protein BJ741DRAFT_712516 [Chytriomyces cf. hyalinus JEL632]|nr:hypothetical protein BJ741DRAFT_712516 [Chytriomyces cf. hyalinus JEL632]
MSLSSGLIPLSSNLSKDAKKQREIDFEIDDDDLDDLLALDTDSSKPTKFTKPAAARFGSKASFEDAPASKASFPKSNFADSHLEFSFKEPTNSFKSGAEESAFDEKEILSKLADMDDMDDGLFANTGLVKKKPSPINTASINKDENSFGASSSQSKPSTPWSPAVLSESTSPTPFEKSRPDPSILPHRGASPTKAKEQDLWSATSNVHSDDDLLESLGLGNSKPAPKKEVPLSSKTGFFGDNPIGAETGLASSRAFNTSNNLNDGINNNSPRKASTDAGFPSSGFSDFLSTNKRESFLSPKDLPDRATSPASLSTSKSKEDEFMPSFLMEASSGRRRRGLGVGGAESSTSVLLDAKNQSYPDPFASLASPVDSRPSFLQSESASVGPSRNTSKKNSLIASVSAQMPSSRVQNDSGSLSRPSFLDAKLKSQIETGFPSLSFSESPFTQAAQKPASQTIPENAPFPAVDTKSLPQPQNPSLSRSSSLSSIVSLGPSDNDDTPDEATSKKKTSSSLSSISATKSTRETEKKTGSTTQMEKHSRTPSIQILSEKNEPIPPEAPHSSKSNLRQKAGESIQPLSQVDIPSSRPTSQPESFMTTMAVTHRDQISIAHAGEIEDLVAQIAELQAKLREEQEQRKLVELENSETKDEIKEMLRKMETERGLVKQLEQKIKAQDEKVVHVRSSASEKVDEIKTCLADAHEKEIVLMKETHMLELENAVKTEKQMISDLLKLEVAKSKAEHDKAVAVLKAKHFDEMSKLISTADAANQLESLAHKMEESSRLVDCMHHKLETDHSYSVKVSVVPINFLPLSNSCRIFMKEREAALQLKERQLVELQRQIVRQQQSLEDERIKLQAKSEVADSLLDQFRKDRDEDQRIMDSERRNLEEQISVMRTEKDLIQRQLHRERLDFVRQRETWNLERKKSLMASSDQEKDLAMEKALLEAKREAVAEVEMEVQRLKGIEQAQLIADRQMIDKDIHSIALKRTELHREAAALRADKIAFENEKQKLAAEIEAFERGWKTAENSVKHAQVVKKTAEEECQKAQSLDSEVRKTLASIQNERLQLEDSKRALESERRLLSKTRQRIVDDRIQLASERTNTSKPEAEGTKSHTSPLHRLQEYLHPHTSAQKLIQAVTLSQAANLSRHSSKPDEIMPNTPHATPNSFVAPTPVTPPLERKTPTFQQDAAHFQKAGAIPAIYKIASPEAKTAPRTTASLSLFQAARIQKDIADVEKAKKVAASLTRYVSQLRHGI